jgi:hypothetical protein
MQEDVSVVVLAAVELAELVTDRAKDYTVLLAAEADVGLLVE